MVADDMLSTTGKVSTPRVSDGYARLGRALADKECAAVQEACVRGRNGDRLGLWAGPSRHGSPCKPSCGFWALCELVRDPRPNQRCWRRCSETHLARGLTTMIVKPALLAPPLRWEWTGGGALPKADADFTAEN